MKIFLLEDDFKLNEAITQILYINKCHVDRFYNGDKAYDALDKFYDLYLLDINVPNINGLEILEKIHQFDPNAKVIIISADNSVETISNAYKKGCIDFIKKPFHIKELELKINRFKKELILNITPNITYDLQQKILFIDEVKVSLSKKERLFLSLLIDNRDNLTSYETLYHYLYDGTEARNALRTLIKRLRQKLGQDIIESYSGEGYQLNIL